MLGPLTQTSASHATAAAQDSAAEKACDDVLQKQHLVEPGQNGESPAEDAAAVQTADKPAAVDVGSVITQVTTRDAYRPLAPFRVAQNPPHVGQLSWKSRFKSLLCGCFTPGTYVRGPNEGDRPGLDVPLLPPKLHREAVLGPKRLDDHSKKTLVLDLDETLVHSSFKPIPNPDYILPVEIDGKLVDVYVLKRPFMDHFMESVAQRFEVVVFTASLAKYADPLLDMLDKQACVRWRLFRGACFPYEGNYVKDLSCLGRDLSQIIIVDNSPHSYIFQPANAVPIGTFIDNMEDQELLELLPVLNEVEHAPDVRTILGAHLHNRQLQQG